MIIDSVSACLKIFPIGPAEVGALGVQLPLLFKWTKKQSFTFEFKTILNLNANKICHVKTKVGKFQTCQKFDIKPKPTL